MPHIVERPVVPIGQPSSLGASYINTTNTYDVAIGGLPFFTGINDKYPYKRETAQYRKNQTDTQKEPGEQTITGWWIRSQSSFHFGAGARFQEPMQGETVQYRFQKSAGVDVFNTGRVTLLPDMNLHKAVTAAPIMVGAVDGTTDVAFFTDGASLYRTDGTTAVAVTWGGTGNILDINQDGKYYYAANSVGIYRGLLSGAAGTLIFTFASSATKVKLGYAKQRVIAGVDNALYEIVVSTSFTVTAARIDINNLATFKTSVTHNLQVGNQVTIGALSAPYNGTWTIVSIPSNTEFTVSLVNAAVLQTTGLTGTVILASNANLPIYTHPSSTWIWTGVADGPNAIYVSGYAGVSGSILRLALDNTGNIPLLNRALTAAEMPYGEQVTALGSYLGKYLVIGTNKGVRIGQIDTSGWLSSGYITYGPLSVTTSGYDPVTATILNGKPVTAIVFNNRWAYCTVSNYIDNGDGTKSSGIIKIDLAKEIAPNQFGYATNLRVSTVTADCTAVAILGASNSLLLGFTGVGVYTQSSTLVTTGYLQTGQIRYFTLEPKHFELLGLRMIPGAKGTFQTSLYRPDGTSFPIITTSNTFDYSQDITAIDSLDTSPVESIALRFTMLSGANQQVGTEDIFSGYQLKATPAVRRQRLVTFPLMNYDFEEDRYGMRVGYIGRAQERLLALENVESIGDVIIVQDFNSNETVRAIIESVQFTRITAADRAYTGVGGIIYCQIRTVS